MEGTSSLALSARKPSPEHPRILCNILRDTPLTFSSTESIMFSRPPLLSSSFPAEISSVLSSHRVDHVLAIAFAPLASSIPPKRPFLSQGKVMSQPPPVDKEQSAWFSGQSKSFLRHHVKGHPTCYTGPTAIRIGALIQGQFFPHPLLLLLAACCFCFSTDTCQKKNNSAPQRHFNNSYSTSVPTTLINKYLLEYNHFLLEWAVFRNEITIIVSKNMYEQQTFNLPGFVLWFMCIKAFPAAPLAFVLAKILLLIGFKPKSVCKKCYTQQPAHPRIHGK